MELYTPLEKIKQVQARKVCNSRLIFYMNFKKLGMFFINHKLFIFARGGGVRVFSNLFKENIKLWREIFKGEK